MFASIDAIYSLYRKHPHICTDTRTLKEGEIFVALHGERFDGNRYAQDALAKGAVAAIVDDPNLGEVQGCLRVRDTLVALQELATHHRKQLQIPVIGITGTNGKTTTKELIRSVLEQKYTILATEGNLNNHIGVPLTLLKLTEHHEMALVEMGAGAPGEIRTLVEIARPTVGLITNVGKAHLQGFGSIQGVLETKSELPEYLYKNGGSFLLNSDDPLLTDRWASMHPLTFGKAGEYVRGEVSSLVPHLCVSWQENGTTSHLVNTNLVGAYNLGNVLAAIAMGKFFDVPSSLIIEGIEAYVPTNSRSQYVTLRSGTALIIDAYNANPSSMKAALENLLATPAAAHIAILGDMLELGTAAEEEHRAVINFLQRHTEIDPLLCGTLFHRLAPKNIPSFPDLESLMKCLEEHPIPKKGVVLIKGSHGVGLQRLADYLQQDHEGEGIDLR